MNKFPIYALILAGLAGCISKNVSPDIESSQLEKHIQIERINKKCGNVKSRLEGGIRDSVFKVMIKEKHLATGFIYQRQYPEGKKDFLITANHAMHGAESKTHINYKDVDFAVSKTFPGTEEGIYLLFSEELSRCLDQIRDIPRFTGDETYRPDEPICAYGFPKGQATFTHGSLIEKNPSKHNRGYGPDYIKIKMKGIDSGFSGGPVVYCSTNKVVGDIENVSVDKKTGKRLGFAGMVPVKKLNEDLDTYYELFMSDPNWNHYR